MDKAGISPAFFISKGDFMKIFLPEYFFDKIWDSPVSFFLDNNIKCLLLDIDNTLTSHDNPEVYPNVIPWLNSVKDAGILTFVISNNSEIRVSPFAKKLGINFVSNAKKPLANGVKKAVKLTNIDKGNMLLIGDQVFTDVLCGKISGVKTILVNPIELEKTKFFIFKRKLENIVLKGKREV